jgi:hypothetical protein
VPTPMFRTTETLPSREELAAVDKACADAFNGLEGLEWKLQHIVKAWSPKPAGLSRRLSEEELARAFDEMEPPRAPAAGPSLADIGAIWSCLQWSSTQVKGMRDLLDDLAEHLDQLDLMRLDLEKAEEADDA